MSCYFRHMQALFAEAGIKITPDNKKDVDRAIHKIVNVTYKNCPAAWKALKAGTADAEKRQEFIQKLRSAFAG